MFDFTDDGLQSDNTHGSILQGHIYELEAHGQGCMLKNVANKRRQFCVGFGERMKTNLKNLEHGFCAEYPQSGDSLEFPKQMHDCGVTVVFPNM